jgi:DnaB-like helicase N terminal domain/Protein of unknown function (DUF3987)
VTTNGDGHEYSLADEQSLLCGLIVNPKAFPEVLERIKPEHFWRDAHQLIYRALCDLYYRGVTGSAVPLASELEARNQFERCGGDDYLLEISQTNPAGINCGYHAGVVREKAKLRALVERIADAQRQVGANGQPAEQILAQTLAALTQIEEGSDGDTELLEGIRPWPDPLADEAYHGIAGEIVRTISPHSEADPAAILFQLLAGLGNMVGRRPHWRVEATRHHLNLFVCIAGKTSKARKGTSFDHVMWILERIDPEWATSRKAHGYTSGEGLIADVADDAVSGGQITPGVSDKRLFWVESEFGGCLTIMARDGNTLSSVSRQAWDGGILAGRSKNRPLRSTGAHISIVGHITHIEANALLSTTNAANGFGNRFLWVCAERSKLLPHGGQIYSVNFEPLLAELRDVQDFIKFLDPDIPLLRDREANAIWEGVYPALSEGRPGILGAVTSRAEAQVMRLAAIYAVMHKDKYIRAPHLNAALACWRYCEQSARFIFGDRLADPNAEKIIKVLAEAGDGGLSRTQLNRKAFGGRLGAKELDSSIAGLLRTCLVEPVPDEPGKNGRPSLRWRCKHAEALKVEKGCALSAQTPSGSATDAWKPF